jgi:hypothetical protein
MPARFATKTFHSLAYYKRLLLKLAEGLDAGLTNREIADDLNKAEIQSPTGKAFSVDSLKQMLKGLRNPLDYPSNLHRAMLQLHFDGELTKVQCVPLISVRPGTQQ